MIYQTTPLILSLINKQLKEYGKKGTDNLINISEDQLNKIKRKVNESFSTQPTI